MAKYLKSSQYISYGLKNSAKHSYIPLVQEISFFYLIVAGGMGTQEQSTKKKDSRLTVSSNPRKGPLGIQRDIR